VAKADKPSPELMQMAQEWIIARTSTIAISSWTEEAFSTVDVRDLLAAFGEQIVRQCAEIAGEADYLTKQAILRKFGME